MTMSAKRRIDAPTPEALDDVWQRRATAAAIQAVRDIVRGGTIPPATAISRLSDIEIGWLVTAGIFGWIRTRAEQATAEGWDIEERLRQTGLDPEPWDAGAVAYVLPQLGALEGFNWDMPIGAWPKDQIIRFLLSAMKLIDKATIARDVGGNVTTKRKSLDEMQRIASAEAGGPLMMPGELDDPIPF
jgi:hypothetical protein